MIAYFIDPSARKISTLELSASKYPALAKIKAVIGQVQIAQQIGVDGMDLLMVAPENVFIPGMAAFTYGDEMLVFGKAVLIGYDLDNNTIENAEAAIEELRAKITFLSDTATQAIPDGVRKDIYSDLILHRRTQWRRNC